MVPPPEQMADFPRPLLPQPAEGSAASCSCSHVDPASISDSGFTSSLHQKNVWGVPLRLRQPQKQQLCRSWVGGRSRWLVPAALLVLVSVLSEQIHAYEYEEPLNASHPYFDEYYG